MRFVKMNTYKIGFILLLLCLFFFFNFQEYFFLHPQGVHFIRQTDSLSFVSNYYHYGFDFFHPSLFNLMSVDGRGACEFPLVYYFVSLLYCVFGEKDFLLKFVHLIIFFIGIFHLFNVIFLLVKDYFYAFVIPLFLFSSVSLVYYSFNFLPDIAALGLSFSGWYYYFKYREKEELSILKISFLFFTLSSLLKVTYLINPLAIIGLFLVELFIFKRADEKFRLHRKKIVVTFFLSLASVVLWNIYVKYYNSLYNSSYFTTSPIPFWSADKNASSLVMEGIFSEWYKKYLAQSSFHFLALVFIFIILSFRKLNKQITVLFLFLVFGSICYFLLFFVQFRFHDYYFLLFSPVLIFLLILGVQNVQSLKLKVVYQIILKVFLLLIVIAGMNYSRIKVGERYQNGNDVHSKVGFILKKNGLLISKLKIPADSKVIIVPDLSINGGLYFLKLKGWNINSKKDLTEEKIRDFKEKGADYMFVVEKDSLLLNSGEKFGTCILKKDDLTIYKF